MQDKTPVPKPVKYAVHTFIICVSLVLAFAVNSLGAMRLAGIVALLNTLALEFIAATVIPYVLESRSSAQKRDSESPSHD